MALPLVAEFDDIMRICRVVTSDPPEAQFLRFVRYADDLFAEAQKAAQECAQLMNIQKESSRKISDLERRLNRARELLDNEKRERKSLECNLKLLENQMDCIRNLLWDETGFCRNKLEEKALLRLASMCSQPASPSHRSFRKRNSFQSSLGTVMDVDEKSLVMDSTGSLLSELGYSQSEEEVCNNKKASRTYGTDAGPSSKRRRSCQPNDVQTLTMKTQDGLRTTTTVTVTKEDPITAKATIETLVSSDKGKSRCPLPTGTPRPPSGTTHPTAGTARPTAGTPFARTRNAGTLRNLETPHNAATPHRRGIPFHLSRSPCLPASSLSIPPAPKTFSSESEESLLVAGENHCPIPQPFNSGLNLMACDRLNGRAHTFIQKAIIKTDHCDPCNKRIKFGKLAAKCRDCHAIVHMDCREKLPLPCIPVSGTPTNRGVMGVISDFTPSQPPMIPALLVHCINEVEARGLSEVGIYRISGSERDVKALKERFLRQKGVPDLSRLDIHVVCSCIKDFLRSLREPLVLPSMWSEFIRCVEPTEEHDQQAQLYQVVSNLPRPNRDTLAYLILHLQRVSDSPACKMPADNLAKVFGPTLVGYSSANPLPEAMMEETIKQVAVVQLMMKTPSSYWSCFVNSTSDNTISTPDMPVMQTCNPSSSSLQRSGFFSTPLSSKSFKNRPKFFTPL